MSDPRGGPRSAETPPPLFGTILVPLDQSAIAPIVFSTAVGLARLNRATLQLLRVVTLAPAFPPAAHAHPDGLDAKLVGTVAAKVVNHADRDVLVVHRRPPAT